MSHEFAQRTSMGEIRLDANKIAGTRRAGLTRFYMPRRKGSALPKSVERGNLSLDKAVIRWTSGGARGQALNLVTRRGGY